jgi:hypothetical protein
LRAVTEAPTTVRPLASCTVPFNWAKLRAWPKLRGAMLMIAANARTTFNLERSFMTFPFSGDQLTHSPKFPDTSKRRSQAASCLPARNFRNPQRSTNVRARIPFRLWHRSSPIALTFCGAASYGKQKTVQYMFGRIVIPAGYDDKNRLK